MQKLVFPPKFTNCIKTENGNNSVNRLWHELSIILNKLAYHTLDESVNNLGAETQLLKSKNRVKNSKNRRLHKVPTGDHQNKPGRKNWDESVNISGLHIDFRKCKG